LRRGFALALTLSALAACHHQGDAVLLIVVSASGSPPAVSALTVTINGPAGKSPTKTYTPNGTTPIVFPTTLSAELPSRATGTLDIDIQAEDAAGTVIAAGRDSAVSVRAGEHKTIYVQLDCSGDPCIIDGGGNDGGPPVGQNCGNGRIDPGETCDVAIAAGKPGACPQSCDDHVACTNDFLNGSDCTASCVHSEIVKAGGPRDNCCPKNATAAAGSPMHDDDCPSTCGNGTVDPFETCDTAIAPGSPGACPSADDCTAGAACISAQLIAAGTCSAVCMRYPIVSQIAGDGCCPAGATHAGDDDCPIVCGDGMIEANETCDLGIAPPRSGACQVNCDDRNPCTTDYVVGFGCQAACAHVPITVPVSGDGCCLVDANSKPRYTQAIDTDCPAVCGNNVVERGEICDPPPPKKDRDAGTDAGDAGTDAGRPVLPPSACPADETDCPLTPSKCLRNKVVGSPDGCASRCVVTEVTDCVADGCCPPGCTADNDPDCALVGSQCGDGVIQHLNGEKCDLAAPQGTPTSCPMSCAAKNCKDGFLINAGTCAAECLYMPTRSFLPGDNCCAYAAGANFTLDPDCTTVCGNGVVESPAESCDFAITGSCPTQDSCPPPMACTRYMLKGSAGACSSTCVATPITACADGDQCCPAGCSSANDSDCPVVWGNGIVEAGETCDGAITAGVAGACPRSCDDGDACTIDFASGSSEACTRSCAHQAITGCIDDDGCCPSGCSAATDRDCAPRCGDGRIGAGETCDPPTTCPTSCPDDGDPCTVEQLVGDAASCTAACRHVPITACLAAAGDRCCPTGCTPANDWDCL